MATQSPHPTASGIEALLERLEAEGVRAGEARAERIVAEAEAKARAIREAAEKEATAMIEAARKEAANLERGGKEALRVAMRDAVLDLKQQLASRFKGEVTRLVTRHMRDEELLRRMILEIAASTVAAAGIEKPGDLEILLPADAVGLAELRRDPTDLKESKLGQFVLGSVRELLDEGLTIGVTTEAEAGVVVRLKDRDIVLDLTDRAVAAVILQHLQPRFRALLEGVIG